MKETEERRIKRYLTRVMLGKEVEGDFVSVKTGKDTTEMQYIERPIPTTLRLKAAEMLLKGFGDCSGLDMLPVVLYDDIGGCGDGK
ncbi:MAG: hypothetical protein J6A07_04965 [Firmicutes bacterium]|nr:hypothetical protein [Bacillota bacterium]